MISDTAVENPGTRRRLRIAVICRELGGRGSVPTVAIRQAQELGRYARVTLLSDSFPDNTDSSLFRHLVTPANLSCLRGFSHVPRELAFAIAVKCGLFRLQEQGAELDFVHCHGHSLVAIAASSFRRRFRGPWRRLFQCSRYIRFLPYRRRRDPHRRWSEQVWWRYGPNDHRSPRYASGGNSSSSRATELEQYRGRFSNRGHGCRRLNGYSRVGSRLQRHTLLDTGRE
jgi:hypothetical protein